MGKDEFEGLFGGDDLAELAAAMDKAAAEHKAKAEGKPKKSGLIYSHDFQDAVGHQISVYALNLGGRTVAWAWVDADLEVPAEQLAQLGHVPAGVTGHVIMIVSADQKQFLKTNGIALKAPFSGGTRISGQTVRAYVVPRMARWIGELYGV